MGENTHHSPKELFNRHRSRLVYEQIAPVGGYLEDQFPLEGTISPSGGLKSQSGLPYTALGFCGARATRHGNVGGRVAEIGGA